MQKSKIDILDFQKQPMKKNIKKIFSLIFITLGTPVIKSISSTFNNLRQFILNNLCVTLTLVVAVSRM